MISDKLARGQEYLGCSLSHEFFQIMLVMSPCLPGTLNFAPGVRELVLQTPLLSRATSADAQLEDRAPLVSVHRRLNCSGWLEAAGRVDLYLETWISLYGRACIDRELLFTSYK